MQDYIPRRIDINGVIDTVTVKQFDNNSRFLEVTICDTDLADDSGNAFDLADCSAALYIQPAGNEDPNAVSFVDGTVEAAESGIVTFLIPGGVTQVAGRYECEICIYEGDDTAHPVISTKPFALVVGKSIKSDQAVEASQSFSALDAWGVRVQSVLSRMDALEALADSGDIPAGTVEAEVIGARTGWNGTTYANLGQAIREQAGNAVSGSGILINNSRFQSSPFNGDFDNAPNNRIYPIHVLFESQTDANTAHSPVIEPGGILITFGRNAERNMGDMQMLVSTFGDIWSGEIWIREYWDVSRNRWNTWHRPATTAETDNILSELHNSISGSGTFVNFSRLVSDFSGDFNSFPNNRIYPVNIDFSASDAVSAGITASSAHAPLVKSGGTLITFGRSASTQASPHKNGDVQLFTTPDGDSWTGEVFVREYWDGWNAWHRLTDAAKRIWKGLKVSVLGDSISSYQGVSVGSAYYSASQIPSVNSMWWKQLCRITGAQPLVIDAYASSCCAVASASWTSSITPGVDNSRCKALHTGNSNQNNRVDPDIILIAMGLNDFQANVPLGSWDGHDALASSDTATWRGAYANMLLKIHTEYPNALVFCLSPWFFVRGNAAGVNINSVGNTYQDYEDAMREVCELMGGVYVDSNNFGFTRQNYTAPNFAIDDNASDGSVFHPNAAGQVVLGQSVAAAVRDKAIGYINWLKEQQGV